jgi:hypothetical protein
LISNTLVTLSEPVVISRSRWLESTGQPNWNTVRPNLENVVYTPSTIKQAAEVEEEAATVVEADTVTGDDKAKVQEEPTLMV